MSQGGNLRPTLDRTKSGPVRVGTSAPIRRPRLRSDPPEATVSAGRSLAGHCPLTARAPPTSRRRGRRCRTASIGELVAYGIPPPWPPSSAADVCKNRTHMLYRQEAGGTGSLRDGFVGGGLRGRGGGGVDGGWAGEDGGWVRGRDAAPPQWIPAFGDLCVTPRGGRGCGRGGSPATPRPPWIPAFAGMTRWGGVHYFHGNDVSGDGSLARRLCGGRVAGGSPRQVGVREGAPRRRLNPDSLLFSLMEQPR